MTKIVNENSKVKVDYVGRFEQNDMMFDTSLPEVAKENEIFNEQREYGPLEVEIGQSQVIPGFEHALLGMSEGDKKTVVIPPEDGYGEVQKENIVAVPDEQFISNNIPLNQGTVIETSQGIATIKGHDKENSHVVLDFNHPLAGRTLKFELEVVEVIN